MACTADPGSGVWIELVVMWRLAGRVALIVKEARRDLSGGVGLLLTVRWGADPASATKFC